MFSLFKPITRSLQKIIQLIKESHKVDLPVALNDFYHNEFDTQKTLTETEKDRLTQIYTAYYGEIHTLPKQRIAIQSVFLTTNTIASSALGYLLTFKPEIWLKWDSLESKIILAIIYIFLTALCYIWFRLLKEYDQLSYAFIVLIRNMEKNLPIDPLNKLFKATKNFNINHNLGKLTNIVPCLFLLIYLLAFAYLITNLI